MAATSRNTTRGSVENSHLRRGKLRYFWLLPVFHYPKRKYFECLDPAGQRSPGLQNATEQILCLTKETRDGIEIFHTSFRDYARTTQAYGVLSPRILTSLRDWLGQTATEAQRWSHLNRIEYELGDSDGIFKTISREWTARSIADCRLIDEILDQLKLGVHAAMESGNYGKAFELGSVSTYLENAPSFCDAAWEKLWAITWILNGGGRPRLPNPGDVAFFGTHSIVRIAKEAARIGERPVLRAAIAELNRRTISFVPVRKEEISDRWWPEAHALASVAALARVQVQPFLNWATSKSIRNVERSADLLNAYLSELCNSGLWSRVDLLFRADLEPKEKIAVVETYSRAAVLSNRTDAANGFEQISAELRDLGPNFCWL